MATNSQSVSASDRSLMPNPHTKTTPTAPVSSTPDFSADPRMHYVQETEKWTYTAEDGVTYEYDETKKAWFPMYNEDLIEAQQSAYSVPGVDESEPVLPKNRTKRKNVYTTDENTEQTAKKQKPNNPNKKKPNTSVYVTGLPKDVTVSEMAEVFSKYGVLMEDYVIGGPRVKIYKDEKDSPKGDALVTYLKEESVTLACQLLDDTDFRPDQPSKIRVQMAEFKPKQGDAGPSNSDSSQKPDKRKIQKKIQKLEKKLEWFDDETGRRDERSSRMVVLKYMFTLQELEEDPGLILELKEEIRTECEKLGEVSNVVLYDQEPDGVVTIKFKDPISAEACVLKNNGRFFNCRRIAAEIYDGKQKFKKTSTKSNETEEEEAVRLEKYAKWLEQDVGGGGPETSNATPPEKQSDNNSALRDSAPRENRSAPDDEREENSGGTNGSSA